VVREEESFILHSDHPDFKPVQLKKKAVRLLLNDLIKAEAEKAPPSAFGITASLSIILQPITTSAGLPEPGKSFALLRIILRLALAYPYLHGGLDRSRTQERENTGCHHGQVCRLASSSRRTEAQASE